MRLSEDEFVKYVNRLQDMVAQENEICDAMGCAPEWTPGSWISSYYELLEAMCELKEDKIMGTILSWYCWELDFGFKGLHAYKVGDEWYDILDAGDLWDYIQKVESNE